MIGFKANSPEQINAWHEASINNSGTRCENPPCIGKYGTREYLAYLRDPAGNKLRAIYTF